MCFITIMCMMWNCRLLVFLKGASSVKICQGFFVQCTNLCRCWVNAMYMYTCTCTYMYFTPLIFYVSLCAGVENYSPGGVHLLIGDSTPLHHGPHPPGYAETLTKQQLLALCICACRVIQTTAKSLPHRPVMKVADSFHCLHGVKNCFWMFWTESILNVNVFSKVLCALSLTCRFYSWEVCSFAEFTNFSRDSVPV